MNRTDNELHRCNDDESNNEKTFTDKVKKSLPHLKRDVKRLLVVIKLLQLFGLF